MGEADVDVPVEGAEAGAVEEGPGFAAAVAEDEDGGDPLRGQLAREPAQQARAQAAATVAGMDDEVLHHAAEDAVGNGASQADQLPSVPRGEDGVRVAEELANLPGGVARDVVGPAGGAEEVADVIGADGANVCELIS